MGLYDWLMDRRLDDASLEEDHPNAKAAADMVVSDMGSFVSWLIYVATRKGTPAPPPQAPEE